MLPARIRAHGQAPPVVTVESRLPAPCNTPAVLASTMQGDSKLFNIVLKLQTQHTGGTTKR